MDNPTEGYGTPTGGRRRGAPVRWWDCECGRVYRGQLPTCPECRQAGYQHAAKCKGAGVERG